MSKIIRVRLILMKVTTLIGPEYIRLHLLPLFQFYIYNFSAFPKKSGMWSCIYDGGWVNVLLCK